MSIRHTMLRLLVALTVTAWVASPALAQPNPDDPPAEQPAQGEDDEEKEDDEDEEGEEDEEDEKEDGDEGSVQLQMEQFDDDGEKIGESTEGDEDPEEFEPVLSEEELAEERFRSNFGLDRIPDGAQVDAGAIDYFLVDSDDGAMLDDDGVIVCGYRPGSQVPIRMQCDHDKKECLVAEEAVFRERSDGRMVPTQTEARMTGACYSYVRPDDVADLVERGYTLVPAMLDTPYGYRRDARNRVFQTHFDQRSRFLLGVHYAGRLRNGFNGSLALESRSTVETWSSETFRRRRFRFLEGELILEPFEARGELFTYEYGLVSDEPLLWITSLIGEPRRLDIYANIGAGLTVGRFDIRQIGNDARQSFLDFAEWRFHWELFQGLALEDYFMLRLGAGVGRRGLVDSGDSGDVYLYPEAGFKGAFLIGPQGLFQIVLDGRVRQAFELDSNETWLMASSAASVEWIVLAVSDQPISLFAQAEALYTSVPSLDVVQGEVRGLAGVRLSIASPPPPEPAKVLDAMRR